MISQDVVIIAASVNAAAAVLNVCAASWNAYNGYRAAKLSRDVAQEQRDARVAADQLQRFRSAVLDPTFEYVERLESEWLPLIVAELPRILPRSGGAADLETVRRVKQLERNLQEAWDRASHKLQVGAGWWNPALLREIERAEETLQRTIARMLQARMSGDTPRNRGIRVISDPRAELLKHSSEILDLVHRYAREPRPATALASPASAP
ncbi:MAG: hypothetical protein JO306_06750 [Gemmatimonadetes bacterium]|nr:hypothetical protein [Gemmatimonadota bacterium]